MRKSKAQFEEESRDRKKKFYVLVLGKERELCRHYSQVREAVKRGAYLKVFNNRKAAQRFARRTNTRYDSYKEFV
jgi:hypothetical protein